VSNYALSQPTLSARGRTGLARRQPTTRAMQSTGLGWAGAERFLVRAFILLRSVQLAQALLVLMLNHAQYDHYPVVVALFGVQAGWSVVLLGRARRLGSYTQSAWCWSDLLLTAASVFTVASLARGGGPETWTNWMFAVGTSTVMAAAVALPGVQVVLGAAVVVAAHLVGALPALRSGQASSSNATGNSLSYIGFAVIALVLARQLRRTGASIDTATERAVAAESAAATERARRREYQRLHDGALATLTLIGAGTLDPSLAPVRERAARDALALREMLEGLDAGLPLRTQLPEVLSELVERRRAEGMTITYLADGLPAQLPVEVVAAFSSAVGEALTNVAKHASVPTAWVTALGDGQSVTVTVFDRGPGFDRAAVTTNRGLSRSVEAPLRAAGGSARIESGPDLGTLVTLAWPR